jgi:hypothetical protein
MGSIHDLGKGGGVYEGFAGRNSHVARFEFGRSAGEVNVRDVERVGDKELMSKIRWYTGGMREGINVDEMRMQEQLGERVCWLSRTAQSSLSFSFTPWHISRGP